MPEGEDRIQLLHPNATKTAPRISRRKYDLVRTAMLSVIPDREPGLAFSELPSRVEACLSPEEVASLGSVGWYTITVKLDLEARGLIVRLPGVSPQRLLRTQAR